MDPSSTSSSRRRLVVMQAKGQQSIACARPARARRLLSRLDHAAAKPRRALHQVEVVEYPELGMEAIWRIEVVDFPASSSMTRAMTSSRH
jgi:fumarate hydratase class I